MKAVVMTRPGGPEVLEPRELEEPHIGSSTQIKVRLRAAGINPIDTKLRSRGLLFPDALPAVLGCDGAGEVVEVGAGVTRLRPGDRVWFCNGGLGREQGNYAEYTLVEEVAAQPMPASVNFAQAAAAPLVLLTAWEALFDRARLAAGQSVLVHAGAGGVGHVAIQLARHAGARVCTTVSTDAKAAFVRDLGADEVIRYRDQDLVEAVEAWTGGRGVDLALDTVGPDVFRRTMPAVAHYGDLVTLLDPGPEMEWKDARARNLRIGFELMLTPMVEDLPEARAHQGEILRSCGDLMESGELRVEVGRTFPLQEAAAAHRLLEEGHNQGKLVLTVGD
ncbi:MAG: zinc-dependent alcohol dehydrogenase family protein [Chromatiales bacterium]